mmetsp:Transcript_16486/g.34267  ORF Transcript_16486/g.34267 Transcript_16486/m.34267 type:complete len:891 (-) Transcript_16486:190-2862(-)
MSDDDNDICPLCCEDLDLSDKQFYPCKCGYQVCMWCWHRIKESESGLCPACRTPYGDDPHEFSAVDMEEVLKANKEKAAAEKREKERLRQQREQEAQERLSGASSGTGSAPSSGNFAGVLAAGLSGTSFGGLGMHSRGGSDGSDLVAALGGSSLGKGPPEPPKDRTQLATMRVIRRNLVYAVGMPPSIATEEILRKPEYFGQYGKISKIVINRNHNPGDPRRASASAYVTFVHKEDTLACILALDGFYHDGRNIRASYGTSKYCSAFIKSVRCNNPDCTYLHHMGDAEDTFTKQEIQAGYVTSGRDVLARQQQIMAQQQAAAFGTSGGSSRKKVGGGGPSGTGKASANPVFPPPTFDEPLPKQTVARTQGASVARSRSIATSTPSVPVGPSASAPSAASIVAGSHQASLGGATTAPAPHTTLTPLTPLTKRASSGPMLMKTAAAVAAKPVGIVGSSTDLTPAESLALDQKKEALAQQQKELSMKMSKQSNDNSSVGSKAPSSPSSIGSGASKGEIAGFRENGATNSNSNTSAGFIGGPTIGSIVGSLNGTNNMDMGPPLLGSTFAGNLSSSGAIESIGSVGPSSTSFEFGSIGHATGSGVLGGQPIGSKPSDDGRNGVIGGMSLAPQSNPFNLDSLLLGSANNSSGVDKWGASGGGGFNGQNHLLGADGGFSLGSSPLWGGEDTAPFQPIRRPTPSPIGPVSRGSGSIAPGPDVGGTSLFTNNSGCGSSALASMLGIQLPTGSGSLRESTGVFTAGSMVHGPVKSHPNGSAPGTIGSKPIGMLPIGAHNISQGGVPIGGFGSNVGVGGISGGNNSSDMALLQSLLPGVNITSGNAYRPAAPQQPVGVGGLNQGNRPIGSDKWHGGLNANSNGSVQQDRRNQDQQRSGNIW